MVNAKRQELVGLIEPTSLVGRHTSNNYGDYDVIEHNGYLDVVIRFVKTGFTMTTDASAARGGKVKDWYHPNVQGIGFHGKGKYSKTNHKICYDTWYNMLRRCYTGEDPAYLDCTVCTEWHNFQNYAEWYHKHYVKGYQVDKDIKILGNKEYSPEACVFVSPQGNSEAALAKTYLLKDPDGVCHTIYNLHKFARENNLLSQHLGKVHSGERKSHKGWTKP